MSQTLKSYKVTLKWREERSAVMKAASAEEARETAKRDWDIIQDLAWEVLPTAPAEYDVTEVEAKR